MDTLITMAAMQKNNVRMIKSLTKAMIGKNKVKKIIDNSDKGE